MPHSPSYQLLLDAINRATTTHPTNNDEETHTRIKSLANKIIDLCENEIINEKLLTKNEVLLILAGLLSSGIILNQKDKPSGVYYAMTMCERILDHVISENER